MQECWDLVNGLEQAWTGVEEADRALVYKYSLKDRANLLMVSHIPDVPL